MLSNQNARIIRVRLKIVVYGKKTNAEFEEQNMQFRFCRIFFALAHPLLIQLLCQNASGPIKTLQQFSVIFSSALLIPFVANDEVF